MCSLRDVMPLVSHCPRLETLDISGNVYRDIPEYMASPSVTPPAQDVPSNVSLCMDCCPGVDAGVLVKVLVDNPNVSCLFARKCGIADLTPFQQLYAESRPPLHTISLEDNPLSSWASVLSCLSSVSVAHLNLSHTRLGDAPFNTETEAEGVTPFQSGLTELILHHTPITARGFDTLFSMFPLLDRVDVRHTGVTAEILPLASEDPLIVASVVRTETVGRAPPRLINLNRSPVTGKERHNAAIYVARMALLRIRKGMDVSTLCPTLGSTLIDYEIPVSHDKAAVLARAFPGFEEKCTYTEGPVYQKKGQGPSSQRLESLSALEVHLAPHRECQAVPPEGEGEGRTVSQKLMRTTSLSRVLMVASRLCGVPVRSLELVIVRDGVEEDLYCQSHSTELSSLVPATATEISLFYREQSDEREADRVREKEAMANRQLRHQDAVKKQG
ncbi:hypothetical protein KIPB_007707 [Kipferlia bialata]|uniref:Uncharacterized protein n=1 Tax=Kipferlia bialata TaxID=797122 RepID=A0A9K3GK89_9EUKA|nr:hypothetical protein KIPB_007707 [Kipferlia bialata]|eukprot:g7707.t1